MGLYDWVWVKCKCPNCGKFELREFQTKDLGCSFKEYEFGNSVNQPFISFLGFCNNCGCSIEALGIIKYEKLMGIKIYRYNISLKKQQYVLSSFHFNKKTRRFVKSKGVK